MRSSQRVREGTKFSKSSSSESKEPSKRGQSEELGALVRGYGPKEPLPNLGSHLRMNAHHFPTIEALES